MRRRKKNIWYNIETKNYRNINELKIKSHMIALIRIFFNYITFFNVATNITAQLNTIFIIIRKTVISFYVFISINIIIATKIINFY